MFYLKLVFKCQDNNYQTFIFDYIDDVVNNNDYEWAVQNIHAFINTIIENNSVFLNPPVACVEAVTRHIEFTQEKDYGYYDTSYDEYHWM